MKKQHLYIFLFIYPMLCVLYSIFTILPALFSATPQGVVNAVVMVSELFLVPVLGITMLSTFLLPLFYFFAVGYLWDKNELGTLKALIYGLSFNVLVTVSYVAVSNLNGFFSEKFGRNFMLLGVVFGIICDIVILGSVGLARLVRGKRFYTATVVLWSVFVAVALALAMYCIRNVEWLPLINDDFWSVLYPLLAFVTLSLYSVLLGRIMTRRYRVLKMIIWYFGIALTVSLGLMFMLRLDFVAFCKHLGFISAFIGGAAIWGFTFIGFGLSRIQTGKAENKEPTL